jgi:hypothetical protein
MDRPDAVLRRWAGWLDSYSGRLSANWRSLWSGNLVHQSSAGFDPERKSKEHPQNTWFVSGTIRSGAGKSIPDCLSADCK